jgi:UrcA family protein
VRKGFSSLPLLAAGLGSLLLGGASATAPAEEVTRLEDLVVTAERMLTVERPSGVVDQELRVKGRVYYSDLDLNTDAGKKELQSRVTKVASDVCTELDKLLPARTLEHGNCVRESVKRAMAEVKGR